MENKMRFRAHEEARSALGQTEICERLLSLTEMVGQITLRVSTDSHGGLIRVTL